MESSVSLKEEDEESRIQEKEKMKRKGKEKAFRVPKEPRFAFVVHLPLVRIADEQSGEK